MPTDEAGLQVLTSTEALHKVPHYQLDQWHQETDAARKYVRDWISVLEPLRTIKGREHHFAFVAERLTAQGMESATGGPITRGTVRKKYFQYCRGLAGKCSPMWEELIDRRAFPRPRDRALDVRFIDAWKARVERESRLRDAMREAHRKLIADLFAWEADPLNSTLAAKFPGYTSPPPRTSHCSYIRQFVPEGWGYRNLSRHKPRQVNKVAITIGNKAASDLLPFNLKTRAGLAYREIIFTDDQDYDNQVTSLQNTRRDMRPQGFNCLDYLTGHFETYGIQLRRLDEDSGRATGLNQEFYTWTVLHDLITNGFRDDDRGTLIIHEHGTAKAYNGFDIILAKLTQGRVRLDVSGRHDAHLFARAFHEGKGKLPTGNFRYKAPLESAFHAVRTRSAGLLGATGNRYQDAPEINHTLDQYTRTTLREIDRLPPELRESVFEMIRWPKHTWQEFVQLMDLVYRAVNNRTDHRLEGWKQCGFVVPGWALPRPGQPDAPEIITRDQYMLMGPEEQDYVLARGRDYPVWLSPAQARAYCQRTDRKIVRLGYASALTALRPEWAYPIRQGRQGGVRVNAEGCLVIRDPARFGEDSLTYFGVAHLDGERIPLRPGEQYLVHVCPYRFDEAILCDLDGRYRGLVRLNTRAAANDPEQIVANQGRINQYVADITRPAQRRHASDIAARRADVEHNDRVLSGEIRPAESTIETARSVLRQRHHDTQTDKGIVHIPDIEPTDEQADVFEDIFSNDTTLDNQS